MWHSTLVVYRYSYKAVVDFRLALLRWPLTCTACTNYILYTYMWHIFVQRQIEASNIGLIYGNTEGRYMNTWTCELYPALRFVWKQMCIKTSCFSLWDTRRRNIRQVAYKATIYTWLSIDLLNSLFVSF